MERLEDASVEAEAAEVTEVAVEGGEGCLILRMEVTAVFSRQLLLEEYSSFISCRIAPPTSRRKLPTASRGAIRRSNRSLRRYRAGNFEKRFEK